MIRSPLDIAAGRWKREAFLEELLRFAARFLFAAAALSWIGLELDRIFGLSSAFRRGFFLLFFGILLYLAWTGVLGLLLKSATSRILDEAEAKFPTLRLYFKSAWELSRRSPDGRTSDDLREAHIAEAERRIGALGRPRLHPLDAAKLSRFFAAAALGLFLFFHFHRGPSWDRVFCPWAGASLEKMLAVSPGNASVDWGSRIEIRASWPRDSVLSNDFESLRLWIDAPSGRREYAWDRLSSSEAEFESGPLSSPLEYQLSWKDLSTRNYRIVPVLPPRLESLRARLEDVQEDFSPLSADRVLEVLSGHLLVVRGDPNQSLEKARMRVSSLARPLSMRRSKAGFYEASFLVAQDADLSFDLETPDGRESRGAEVYKIKAVPDLPPDVKILYPEFSVEGSPQDSLPISYLAQDDGGLVRIALALTLPNGKSRERVVENPGNPRQLYGDATLDFSTLPLGTTRLQVKAVDNAHPPQSGLSAPRLIRVVDFSALHEKSKEIWTRADQDFKDWSRRERQVAAALSPAAAQKFAKADAGLKLSAEKALDDLASLSAALAQDPYAAAALGDAVRSLDRRLAAREKAAFKKADAAAAEGRWALARQIHEDMAEAVQKAAGLLSEAGASQNLADAASSASQAAEEARGLASELSQARSGEALTALEREKVRRAVSEIRRSMRALAETLKNLAKAGTPPPNAAVANLPIEAIQKSLSALDRALSSGDFSEAARITENLARQAGQLESMTSALARGAAFARSLRQAAGQLMAARQKLSAAIQSEEAVHQKTGGLEADRLRRELQAQRDLLRKLFKMQDESIASAEALGSRFPAPALKSMREVRLEFESGKAGNSDRVLGLVSQMLDFYKTQRPAPFWDGFIDGENRIRKILEAGVEVTRAGLKTSGLLALDQDAARGKALAARRAFEDAAVDVSGLPWTIAENIGRAERDESSARSFLGAYDSRRALESEESALSELNASSRALDQALNSQQSLESAFLEGFQERPSTLRMIGGGPPGLFGAETGPVLLPKPRDYQPLQTLRRDIEEALKAKIPEGYEAPAKTYLRRIAQ